MRRRPSQTQQTAADTVCQSQEGISLCPGDVFRQRMRIWSAFVSSLTLPLVNTFPTHSFIVMSAKRKASLMSSSSSSIGNKVKTEIVTNDETVKKANVKKEEIDLLSNSCQKWLMKSEAEGKTSYNINRLVSETNQTTAWEGVRNYVARNHMREMKLGDLAFFYHSNAKDQTGIVGIVVITEEFYNDPSYTDPGSPYYDPKFNDPSRWSVVEVTLVQKLDQPVLLSQLREDKKLQDMDLLKKGNRLSVQKVTDEHWSHIIKEYVMK